MTKYIEEVGAFKMNINYKKLKENAIEPTHGSEYSAGLDLYACTDKHITMILPHETKKIGTGIAMEIPDGYFGAVFARSGLATKQGLRPANCVGVIDADYRGEIIVALHNDSDEMVELVFGDRIAQLVVLPYLPIKLSEVGELTETVRGFGGFGSTGVSLTDSKEIDGQMSLF